ncbi:MAG: transketolase [Methanobacteriota archaeon]
MPYDDAVIHELEVKSLAARRLIIDAVHHAGSGHPGGSLSVIDILVSLYFAHLHHDPRNPDWEMRDRLILSKGHSCPAQYACLAMSGYFPIADLKTLRKAGSHLQGHPARGKTPGVEFNGGSEAQGLSGAVGMALAIRLDKRPGRVFCVLGDGECQEGQVWEAAMAAAHYKLENVTAILDRNGLETDGPTEEIMAIEPIADKWRAFGWHVIEVDGHSHRQILEALDAAKEIRGRPTILIAKTVKGKGVSFMEGSLSWHGKAPSEGEVVKATTEFDLYEKRLRQSYEEKVGVRP